MWGCHVDGVTPGPERRRLCSTRRVTSERKNPQVNADSIWLVRVDVGMLVFLGLLVGSGVDRVLMGI